MKIDLKKFSWVLTLSKKKKVFILIFIDSIIFYISFSLSLWINNIPNILLGTAYNTQYLWIFPILLASGIPLYIYTGQYKNITRYTTSQEIYKFLYRNARLIFIVLIIGLILKYPIPSEKFLINFWIILSINITISRTIMKDILNKIIQKDSSKKKICIFGAGIAGTQLARSILRDNSKRIILFADDNKELWGRSIYGIKIFPFDEIYKYKDDIDQVLLATTNINLRRKKELLKSIEDLSIEVLFIPSLSDLSDGKAEISQLRKVSVNDLIGRENVVPKIDLILDIVKESTIFVSGAGGSIGSELCREILKYNPKRLILLEMHEPSLYKIDQELNTMLNDNIEIISILGSANDYSLLIEIFKKYKVNYIFHTAAYKHVPIVEANPLQGILNNIVSTKSICASAQKACVEKVILISSDKAVRPSNVMGASKRLCELIVQSYSEMSSEESISRNSSTTIFSMVRFGNVIDSSGSVVPLFRSQIEAGGPITLTHNEINRYFMTVTEAAQLVIQTASLAQGGDIFLLDMGEPIKILDLAKRMIKLSGKKIMDKEKSINGIEIITTGLRAGEKLYEELLIDGNALNTTHPLIFKGKEKFIPKDILFKKLEKLETAIRKRDEELSLGILYELVPQWSRKIKN